MAPSDQNNTQTNKQTKYFIQFGIPLAELWTNTQISAFKKVPRGLVGFEVHVPPHSRVLWGYIRLVITFVAR